MKRTQFSFQVVFITDAVTSIRDKLGAIPGVESVDVIGDKSRAELLLSVVFVDSVAAEKLHRKIMNTLIKAKEQVRITSVKTVLSDVF
jgi:hypothetical protein